MAATYYPAIIERGAKGYSVFFPDLPGCASGGDTIDQAARHAEDALRGHLALMVTDGDDIPEATALDQIAHDPDVEESARILVRAELPGKSMSALTKGWSPPSMPKPLILACRAQPFSRLPRVRSSARHPRNPHRNKQPYIVCVVVPVLPPPVWTPGWTCALYLLRIVATDSLVVEE